MVRAVDPDSREKALLTKSDQLQDQSELIVMSLAVDEIYLHTIAIKPLFEWECALLGQSLSLPGALVCPRLVSNGYTPVSLIK